MTFPRSLTQGINGESLTSDTQSVAPPANPNLSHLVGTITTIQEETKSAATTPTSSSRTVMSALTEAERSGNETAVVKKPPALRLNSSPDLLHRNSRFQFPAPGIGAISSSSLPPRPIIILPPESKHMDFVDMGPKLDKETYHSTRKARSKDKTRSFYFKASREARTPENELLPELEVGCASLYQLVTDQVPCTYLLHNDSGKFVGVLSEEIHGFVPVSEDPLKDKNLDVSFIAEKSLPLTLLEQFEVEIKALERQAYVLKRTEADLKEVQAGLVKRQHTFLEAKKRAEQQDINNISAEYKVNALAMAQNFEEIFNNAQAIRLFYSKIRGQKDSNGNEYGITEEQFTNFRIIKGTAIELTCDKVEEEADLHQNQHSKFGERMDFDMSQWPFMYEFNDKSFWDQAWRTPLPSASCVFIKDIQDFPVLSKYTVPFYWPTNTSGLYSNMKQVALQLANVVVSKNNPYPQNVQSTYQKLKDNSLFKHYQYATLLKYMLCNTELSNDDHSKTNMSRKTLSLHIREDRKFAGRPLIECMAERRTKRLSKYANRLIMMKQFAEFYKEDNEAGCVVLTKFITEINARNEQFQKKAQEINKEIEVLNKYIEQLEVKHTQLQAEDQRFEGAINRLLVSATSLSVHGNTPTPGSGDNELMLAPDASALAQLGTQKAGNGRPLLLVGKELETKRVARDKKLKAVKIYEDQIVDTLKIVAQYQAIGSDVKAAEALNWEIGEFVPVKDRIIDAIHVNYLDAVSMNKSQASCDAAKNLLKEIDDIEVNPLDEKANTQAIAQMKEKIRIAHSLATAGRFKTSCLEVMLKNDGLWNVRPRQQHESDNTHVTAYRR